MDLCKVNPWVPYKMVAMTSPEDLVNVEGDLCATMACTFSISYFLKVFGS
jgi:hypothetical protein